MLEDVLRLIRVYTCVCVYVCVRLWKDEAVEWEKIAIKPSGIDTVYAIGGVFENEIVKFSARSWLLFPVLRVLKEVY